jgi:hypothetical protein
MHPENPTGPEAHKREDWLEAVWEGIDAAVDLLLQQLVEKL